MVPGNHDIDWTEDDQLKKQERFRRLCRNHPRVLTPFSTKPYIHFKSHNVLIWCFNSCSLGGVRNPQIETLVKDLKGVFESLRSSPPHPNQGDSEQLLAELEKLSRQDPGYITPEDRAELEATISSDHDSIFKIAVMHHNPSLLPTEDEDAFQTIVNGGVVKQLLMRKGFDLILHGHRHFPHASYEEFLDDNTVRPRSTDRQLRHGIYTVSGASLGCPALDETRWFEIVIEDSRNVNEKVPPSSLVSIKSAVLKQQQYVLKDEPSFRITIGKRVHADLQCLHERLGRALDRKEEKGRIREAIENIQMPLLQLQANLEDWNVKKDNWASRFHGHLTNYCFIYGTDNLGPTSWLNPVYLEYLARQFRERRNRMKFAFKGAKSELRFSTPVLQAIKKTGWKPMGMFAPPQPHDEPGKVSETMLETRQARSGELEIARILIWDERARLEVIFLRMIERYHQMFGVPVFVLPSEKVTNVERAEEFVLGLDVERRVDRCFMFPLDTEDDTGDVSIEHGARKYLLRFDQFLAHPDLVCIASIPGCELFA